MTRSRTVAAVLAGALATLAVLAAGWGGLLDRVEHAAEDARFAVRGTQPVDGLAIVAIDEGAIQSVGEWPFRRRVHARVIDRLRAAGVRQIAYDVQFTEPSANPGDDLALYDAVARAGDVVLATAESDARGRTAVLGGDASLRRAGNAVAGASNFPAGPGGVIRDYEPRVGRLRTFAAATAAKLGRPVAFDGRAAIDFRGPPGTIPTFAFDDVLAGRVPATALRGRTVVVGATAASLQDVHPTAVSGDGMMSGPEIQANAIWTATHGNPLRRAGGLTGVLLAVGLGLLGIAAVLRLGPFRGVAAAVVVGAGLAVAAQLRFDAGVILPVAVPLAALAAATLATAVLATAAAFAERRRIARYSTELEAAVQARTSELAETQLEIVSRLARAGELRDDDTGEHVDRMSRMCGDLARELGLGPERAELTRQASVLHDVGKIGVPDAILRKPGRLDDDELAIMRGHALAGARILAGSASPVLQLAERIARTHHERWDGTGYPAGLAGDEIPLEGRIAAVADVFDALTHARPYKAAWSVAEAHAEIERCAGTHFDPAVVEAFSWLIGTTPAPAPAPVAAV